MFPVFKAQEFTADERNFSGNTLPKEQKYVWHQCLLQARRPPYWQGTQHLLEKTNFGVFFKVGTIIAENLNFHQPQTQQPKLKMLLRFRDSIF